MYYVVGLHVPVPGGTATCSTIVRTAVRNLGKERIFSLSDEDGITRAFKNFDERCDGHDSPPAPPDHAILYVDY